MRPGEHITISAILNIHTLTVFHSVLTAQHSWCNYVMAGKQNVRAWWTGSHMGGPRRGTLLRAALSWNHLEVL